MPSIRAPFSEAEEEHPLTLYPITRFHATFRPLSLTPLIGRENELARLLAMLRRNEVRLVTLTGAGGIGKTRLATEAARLLVDDFSNGVAFVSLGAVRDPNLAVFTIAQSLGVRDLADRSTIDRIRISLADAELLLVLDNLEQVLAVAPQIAELLAGCPNLKVLTTSRGALHLPGEQELPLAPLPVLAQTSAATPAEIEALPSVRLFVERAASVRPDFTLNERNAVTIAAICRQLDGLPLAIELAAARSKIFPPAAILSRLEHRLSFLTAGSTSQPVRLQTLRNAIAWSYDLLTPDEQRLFRRLGVFAASFTLAAAEVLSRQDGPGFSDPLDGVTALVDKGMIVVEENPDDREPEPRFRMLESIREFALEQLAEHGELEAVRTIHAAYMLDTTEQAEAIYLRGEDAPWLIHRMADEENIRAALAWLIERQDADRALRFCGATVWLWFVRGQFTEGRDWTDRILTAPWTNVPTAARCRALYAAGMLAHYQGDQPRVRTVLSECETLSRAVGDELNLGRSLLLQGVAAEDAGRYAEAVPLIEEALELFRAQGDKLWTAQALVHQGIIAFGQRDLATATARCREGLAVYETVGNKLGAAVGISGALDTLSLAAMQQEAYADAIQLQRQSIRMRSDLGDRRGVGLSLASFATIAAATGDFERATRLFGAAEALQEAVGSTLAHPEIDLYDAAIAQARRRLPEDRFSNAWSAGRMLSLTDAVTEATADTSVRPSVPAPNKQFAMHGLTSRELEVLRLIADGLSDREIADTLFISPRTVMRHVANVFNKLDLHSRGAAGAYARQHGLI